MADLADASQGIELQPGPAPDEVLNALVEEPQNGAEPGGGAHRAGCTPAQMRRFIKSRPYIPLHELRRRFQINGPDDEVHSFDVESAVVFVGLPEREARILGDLVRQGEVGYELLLDPEAPLVVGVFPMRPVPHS